MIVFSGVFVQDGRSSAKLVYNTPKHPFNLKKKEKKKKPIDLIILCIGEIQFFFLSFFFVFYSYFLN